MYVGYIYKITNKLNGKSYIGKTNNIVRRWKEHRYGHGGTAILNKAFIKYGLNNFDFSIISTKYYNSVNELNAELSKLEIYYIGAYNTFKNGYNATIGGDGISFYKHTKETIEKISKANKGRKVSAKVAENLRKAMLGKHHSIKTRNKIRQALLNRDPAIYKKVAAKNKGKRRNHDIMMKAAAKRKKPILQYDSKGNFVREYDGIIDAGFNTTANIAACCKNRLKSAYGYIWRYKTSNNYPLSIKVEENTRALFYKTVLQLNKNKELIGTYKSASDASAHTNIGRKAINNCLYGRSRSAGGYIWKFKEEIGNEL